MTARIQGEPRYNPDYVVTSREKLLSLWLGKGGTDQTLCHIGSPSGRPRANHSRLLQAKLVGPNVGLDMTKSQINDHISEIMILDEARQGLRMLPGKA
jgi:hypothetical protein